MKENRCYGCMKTKPNQELICPYCGWDNSIQDENAYIPQGTLLHNRYIIGKVIGHGGFGITYIALDKTLDIVVAIKEYLPSEFATRVLGSTTISIFGGEKQEQYVYGLKRFLDEAKTLARYNAHPCIVSTSDFFEENNTAYLVMEFLDGIPLNEYLKRKGGKISYKQALEIMMPIMDALREVHESGLIHRDISPDNIYITSKGQIKLLDFGAARFALGEKSKSLSVILKPGFAPPEQYSTKGKQGPWTDIYAVAATVFRAITGINVPEAMDRVMEDAFEYPSKLGVHLNAKAEKALVKALSVRPENRYQTIDVFQKELLINNVIVEEVKQKPELIKKPVIQTTYPTSVTNHQKDVQGLNKKTDETYEEKHNQLKDLGVKNRWKILIGIIAIIITIVVITSINRVDIPNVISSPVEVGVEQLENSSFDVAIEYCYHYNNKGTIFNQSHTNKARKGRKITLYVSKGPENYFVTSYKGQDFVDVKEKLINNGLSVQTKMALSDVYAVGEVAGQSITDQALNSGETITLYKCIGQLPSIEDLNLSDNFIYVTIDNNKLHFNNEVTEYEVDFTLNENEESNEKHYYNKECLIEGDTIEGFQKGNPYGYFKNHISEHAYQTACDIYNQYGTLILFKADNNLKVWDTRLVFDDVYEDELDSITLSQIEQGIYNANTLFELGLGAYGYSYIYFGDTLTVDGVNNPGWLDKEYIMCLDIDAYPTYDDKVYLINFIEGYVNE